jgi:hypothetical protein
MKQGKKRNAITTNAIQTRILCIRDHRVILDHYLAQLYEVELRVLIQAVKRNRQRFPDDFMFQLRPEEYDALRSQSVILETSGRGKHRKYHPYVFTEQGVSMLSAILHSGRAIDVSISIMRAFVKMRQLLSVNEQLAKKLEELENKLIDHDDQIGEIVETIRGLMQPPEKPIPKIGYKP